MQLESLQRLPELPSDDAGQADETGAGEEGRDAQRKIHSGHRRKTGGQDYRKVSVTLMYAPSVDSVMLYAKRCS